MFGSGPGSHIVTPVQVCISNFTTDFCGLIHRLPSRKLQSWKWSHRWSAKDCRCLATAWGWLQQGVNPLRLLYQGEALQCVCTAGPVRYTIIVRFSKLPRTTRRGCFDPLLQQPKLLPNGKDVISCTIVNYHLILPTVSRIL